MATRYPVILVDKNNETRIQGFVEFTDPATTPVFNGGTITTALTIAPTNPATVPLTITLPTGASSAGPNVLTVNRENSGTVATLDPYGTLTLQADTVDGSNGGGALLLKDHLGAVPFDLQADAGGGATPGTDKALYRYKTTGALATIALVSTTAAQVDAQNDRAVVIPFTGDGTNNAATLKIELSPDNSTFSTLDTLSIAAALNLTGALNTPVTVIVPAGWYIKLTATHGAIGTATYY